MANDGNLAGYVDYNVAAKRLDRRTSALGGQQLLACGLGDDQHPLGYEATLDGWLQDLWTQLRLRHPQGAQMRQVGQCTCTSCPRACFYILSAALSVMYAEHAC